jgi:hypothetical protein
MERVKKGQTRVPSRVLVSQHTKTVGSFIITTRVNKQFNEETYLRGDQVFVFEKCFYSALFGFMCDARASVILPSCFRRGRDAVQCYKCSAGKFVRGGELT